MWKNEILIEPDIKQRICSSKELSEAEKINFLKFIWYLTKEEKMDFLKLI